MAATTTVPREWEAQDYLDPRQVLIKFGEFERQIAEKDIPEKVRSLRVRSLRPAHYLRQAALFSYGMTQTCRVNVEFALFEDRDIDCLARWIDGDTLTYCPIQLKELVPAHLNASAEIEEEIEKLKKYTDAREIVVALYINRQVHLDFPFKAPEGLGIRELWIYGATTPDLKNWMLYGDILGSPTKFEYEYPS